MNIFKEINNIVKLFVISNLVIVILSLNVMSGEKIRILNTGEQAGHYLFYNNKPILLIGDSVTQGWMETGTNFNYTGYVDALASRGINVLMIWSYIGTDSGGQIGDSRIAYDAPEVWPWFGSSDTNNFNLLQFNQAYFDRLKALVNYAESRGIVVLITVHDGWTKGRFNRHPFNASEGNGPLTVNSQYVELADYYNEMPVVYNPSWTWQQKNQYFQERFVDKLITELEPYSNVIYEMFNEGEWYDDTRRNLHEQHFLAFFKARTTSLLLTNTDGISGDQPHDDWKVDIISLHGGWSNRFGDFTAGYNKSPAKPYFFSEPVPGWDGTNNDLATIRNSMWSTSMAGAGWVNQDDPSFGWDPNTAIASQAGVRDLAYDYAGNCARFFNNSGVNFSNMHPDGSFSSTGISLVQEGAEYAIYAPNGGNFTVDLSDAVGRTLNVRWYDPRNGIFTDAGSINGGNSAEPFSAPSTDDWVLHIYCSHTFDDVSCLYWSYKYIEALVSSGITSGCQINPPLYCPESNVRRDQMAVFLTKSMGEAPSEPCSGTIFNDVPSDHWACGYIEKLYLLGGTGGCAPHLYCPANFVNRDSMAVFLIKSINEIPVSPCTGIFDDVPPGYWACGYIERLIQLDITSGCATNLYCPSSKVTRAQMAKFLVLAFNL